MFYLFEQNNSGGSFDVDDKVCHRVFIEADSERDAIEKAENLGCYWDGVENGVDCPCCGDRWNRFPNSITNELLSNYKVSELSMSKWNREYGGYKIVKPPVAERSVILHTWFNGVIAFANVEEYAQYLANRYGWTKPDGRIFYKNGTVTEIYRKEN